MWVTYLDVHYPGYGRLTVLIPGVAPDYNGQWVSWSQDLQDWGGRGLTVICAWQARYTT